MRRWRVLGLVMTAPVLASACVVLIQNRTVEEVGVDEPRTVLTPIRAYLTDGSLAIFPAGASIGGRVIRGTGARYDLLREYVGETDVIPLDSVLGLEAYNRRTDPGLSAFASVGATALGVVGGTLLAVAIFGSCPTVYVMAGDSAVLEAETFSYSISPLLEGRDVDELSATADAHGIVELEIRNEALETHFINHLELLEVRHAADQRVMPDNDKLPVIVGPIQSFDRVVDRDGRDVTAVVAEADDRTFRTADERLRAVSAEDDRDWIEAVLPPTGSGTAAVVLRLRNSLLNTVLFYDFVLGAQGAGALDWLARDIERIDAAVELGSWYTGTMGLRLEVETEDGFTEVARFADTGPIAWSEVAFRVPTRPGASTRIRFSFLADEWRIDRLGWSSEIETPHVRVHPVESLEPIAGPRDPSLRLRVTDPDDRYLVTSAGTAFTVRFDAGILPQDERRTFLLASQGYYTEWVRPQWIRSAAMPKPFRPTPDLVAALIDRWIEVMDDMEGSFYATRIPVR